MSNLQFQIVDWYGTDRYDEEDTGGYQVAEAYDVNIFGRTVEGQSVALQVTGFTPYFYVKVPSNWDDIDVNKFKAVIIENRKILASTLVNILLIEKYPFQGFTNHTKSKFIKMEFATKQAMIICRNLFQKWDGSFEVEFSDRRRAFLRLQQENKSWNRGTKSKASLQVGDDIITKKSECGVVVRIMDDCGYIQMSKISTLGAKKKFKYELFESNIDPMIRLGHKQGLKPSGWIQVQRYNKHNMNETNCDIAISCDWEQLVPVENDEIGPIRVCAFDIECTSSHGDFPQAMKTYETPAREIVMDLQRLTSTRRTGRDEWAYRQIMNHVKEDGHVNLLRSYIHHLFSIKSSDEEENDQSTLHDISRIHTVNTKKHTIPSTKKIDIVIQKLMCIFDSGKEVLRKKNIKAAEKKTKASAKKQLPKGQQTLTGFIKDDTPVKKRVSDIFINCKYQYEQHGTMFSNKVRNSIINRVCEIFDKYLPPLEGDAVVQISNCFTNYGDKNVENILFTLGDCNKITNCTVVKCNSETELLLQWTKMVQTRDPDILAGYNSYGFDLPYMYNRAKELGILEKFQKLSKLSQHKSEMKEKRLASAALGDNIWYDVPIVGRIHVDIMRVVQRDFNLSSYRLDYVASYFMNGTIKGIEQCSEVTDIDDADTPLPCEYKIVTDNTNGLAVGSFVNIQINNGLTTDMYGDDHASKFHITEVSESYIIVRGQMDVAEVDYTKYKCYWCHAKDDMEYSAIFAAFNDKRNTPELVAKRTKIGQYCLKDSILCIDLINKLDIVANNIGMSNVCSVPLSWIFSRGQGAKTLSLVAKQCAKEDFLVPTMYMDQNDRNQLFEGAIVLDPEPGIYLDSAIATLDYASLYPSCIISENMSHDTIVLDDQWKGVDGGKRLKDLGYEFIDINWDRYRKVGTEKKRICTETTRFVQFPNNEKGIIPRILQDLLRARKKTRKRIKYKTVTMQDGNSYTGLVSSKDSENIIITTGDGTQHSLATADIVNTEMTHSSFQQGILDGLQKAYKITANSIYGQMGARTSPVKMIPIAACTTATGRALLLLARDKIKEEYSGKTLTLPDERSVFIRSAKTIYGDTDSVFVRFSIYDKEGGTKLTGKDLLYAAIHCGVHSSKYATKFLKAPHDLEYEKAFYPFILLSKKRYVGMKYEMSVDKCKQTSMGIVLKRRDNAKILKFVFGGAIDIIMKEQNVEKAFRFVQNTVEDIIAGKYGMDYLIITKSLRTGYKNPESIAHKVLADRMGDRDPGNRPKSNDRIPYVFIIKNSRKGENILQGDRIETPTFIREHELDIDYQFYITNQISKPVSQVFALIIDQLPNYRLQKKIAQLQQRLRKYPNEQKLITKQIRMANEKYAAELLFSDALRKIKNLRKGQKEITHFTNVIVPGFE